MSLTRALVLASVAVTAQAGCDLIKLAKEMANNAQCITDAATGSTDTCEIYQAYLDCMSGSCCSMYMDTYGSLYGDCGDAVCSGGGCFPATAEVELATSEKVSMDQLKVGDKVLVGEGEYSEVYFFTTELASTTTSFVNINTATTELSLTPGHYLYVNGELTMAGRVMVGDVVTLADGSDSKVTGVSSKWGPGLYNPHTMDGDIIVDGVKTSTYTGAVHPTLAHALLYPVRKMYEAGITFGETFSTTAKNMPKAVLDLIQA